MTTRDGETWRARLGALTVALLALAFAGGIFLPVYTDEVGWRLQERAGFDGVDKLFSDLCGPNTLAAPPFFMLPVRFYSATFNAAFASPFYVRLSGVLYALAWLALIVALIRRIAPDRPERSALLALGPGLMGLGIMPLLLVWSRPEQPILLALTGALLLALGSREEPGEGGSVFAEWARALAILCCAIVALSYHFKAVMLVPAFAGCIWWSARRAGLAPRLVSLALLGAVTWSSLHYWLGRLDCAGDPLLAAERVKQSLGPGLLFGGSARWHTLLQMLNDMDPRRYARLASPSAGPMSHWLAADQVTDATEHDWDKVLVVLWYVLLLLGLAGAVMAGVEGRRRRVLDARLGLSLLILCGALGWMSLQLAHNDYEASFVLPLLMLFLLLSLASAPREAVGLPLRLAGTGVGLALPLSLAFVAAVFAPSLREAYFAKRYPPRQLLSLPITGYAEEKPVILRAARLCGIVPGRSRKLLIDDLTYFPFMANPLPQHELGVLNGVSKGSITDPVAYLKSIGSQGAIVQCRFLSPELRARAKQDSGYCCLGPPNW